MSMLLTLLKVPVLAAEPVEIGEGYEKAQEQEQKEQEHEHTEDCYTQTENCVHEHTSECYPPESVSENEATSSGVSEPIECAHICSEESGCITKELNCPYEGGGTPATVETSQGNETVEDAGHEAESAAPSNVQEAVTVESVQAIIDALPETITEDNAGDVEAQLEAIDKAKVQLSDEKIDALDFSRYRKAVAVLEQLSYGLAAPSNAVMPVSYNGTAIVIGTSGISDPVKASVDGKGDHWTPSAYVYFGVNGGNGTPIKWRVLDADNASDGTTSGMFLLSEYLLASGVSFDDSGNSNAYQGSNAQQWCSTFAGNADNFSTVEQAAMLGIAKTDVAEKLFDIVWGASSLTANDKLFFLSTREVADYVANYQYAPGLRATDTSLNEGTWWLRSPDTHPNATLSGAVFAGYGGYVHSTYVNYSSFLATRPAFNLNLNSVLFTSDANGGKVLGANGLAQIPTSGTTEWRLTMLDSGREFQIAQSSASVNAGDNVTLNYYKANVGTNEYISAILADSNGNATHYGRIEQPVFADGTVSIAIPSDLASGTYTLHVFSEQYNGGEYDNTKLTDYASQFDDVMLTVSGSTGDATTPALTNGSATRDGAATATVKFTSNKGGENTIFISALSGTQGAYGVEIVLKDSSGKESNRLQMTIPAYDTTTPVSPTYTIAAHTNMLDFGNVKAGYELPTAQVVIITNTGNQEVTLSQPAASHYTVGELTQTTLAAGKTAAITVQPKSGLAAGTYSETITIQGGNGSNKTNDIGIQTKFVVEKADGGSQTHTHTWDEWTSNGNGTHTRTCTLDSSHTETKNCSGGTVTCQSGAVCETCKTAYGERNAGNHTGGTEVRGRVEATTSAAGYTGDTWCLGCNTKIASGQTIPKKESSNSGSGSSESGNSESGNSGGNSGNSNSGSSSPEIRNDIQQDVPSSQPKAVPAQFIAGNNAKTVSKDNGQLLIYKPGSSDTPEDTEQQITEEQDSEDQVTEDQIAEDQTTEDTGNDQKSTTENNLADNSPVDNDSKADDGANLPSEDNSHCGGWIPVVCASAGVLVIGSGLYLGFRKRKKIDKK